MNGINAMSDGDLLEFAAKACGYRPCRMVQEERNRLFGRDQAGLWISAVSTDWNPLTDDGHALRLAAKLKISINFSTDVDDHAWAQYHSIAIANADHRRAIVMVAAAIGRMEP